MSTWILIMGIVIPFVGASAVVAQDQIEADQLGLSKTDVFSEPTPKEFRYNEGSPGSPRNPTLEPAFPGAPPQIPHDISAFMPVTTQSNQCLGCHNNPAMRNVPKRKGVPTPMPESHYTEPAFGNPEPGLPGKVEGSVSGSRYVCTQCHAPQADVKPLVRNTF